MYESDDKMVSHPDHYQSKSGLEVIDVIEAFTEDLSGIEATDTGNIIKYICRWKQKNGIQDLKKIMWYTQHLIDHLEHKKKFAEPMKTNNPWCGTTYDEAVIWTNDGFDILMPVICGCENVQRYGNTLRGCETYCMRYSTCDNVALANDILANYETNNAKETK